LSSNDDKAKAIAKQIVNDYLRSLRNIPKSVSKDRAKQYAADARKHTADELAKLAKGPGISSGMRRRIEGVSNRARGHKSDHGSWWADDSGPNDNPSSWI
jgi:hypothetical protein